MVYFSGDLTLKLLHIPITEVRLKVHILVKRTPTIQRLKLNSDGASRGYPGLVGGGGGFQRCK